MCNSVTPEHAYSLNSSLPVWFRPVWMNAIAELHRLTPKVLVCYKNGNSVAFLPYYEKRFVTLKKAFNPLLVYYSPVIFNVPSRKHANRVMLLEYEITRCMGDFLDNMYRKVLLNLSPEFTDIRGFRDAGFKIQPQYTFVQNLGQTPEFFLGEMAKLRIAGKEGYAFSMHSEPEIMVDLLLNMFKRKQHLFLSDKAGLLKLIDTLHKEGLTEQYNVMKNNRIVSTIIVIRDRDKTAYGWMAASEPEDMKKGASLYLFRELFSALGKQINSFDLCGANSKGPSRLKAALGAELKLFFQIIK